MLNNPTKLIYLEDTYLFKGTGKIIDITEVEGEKCLILDQTIFYPQGGGQPFDLGEISNQNGIFEVQNVRLNPEGQVFHFGKFIKGNFEKGENVELFLDKERRILNSKLHSAGHLIDCGVSKLGLNIKATKGFHFETGPYVEYEGEIENQDEITNILQKNIDELIKKDIKVIKTSLSDEEAKTRGIIAPEGKSVRLIGFEGFLPCGCGGTHINSTKEIGKINILKIKSKKGTARVSYSVEN